MSTDESQANTILLTEQLSEVIGELRTEIFVLRSQRDDAVDKCAALTNYKTNVQLATHGKTTEIFSPVLSSNDELITKLTALQVQQKQRNSEFQALQTELQAKSTQCTGLQAEVHRLEFEMEVLRQDVSKLREANAVATAAAAKPSNDDVPNDSRRNSHEKLVKQKQPKQKNRTCF